MLGLIKKKIDLKHIFLFINTVTCIHESIEVSRKTDIEHILCSKGETLFMSTLRV